jgi:hypothetical protein
VRKSVVIAVILLLLASVEASALHLAGELVYLGSIESQYHVGELGGAGGSLTLLDLGIAQVSVELRVLGSAGLDYLPRLYLRRIPAQPVSEAVFLLSDALVAVSAAWPLSDDMRLAIRAGVGDVAYIGAKPGEALSYNIYRGLRVKGELRKGIMPSAELFANVEYGPHLANAYGTHDQSSANWRGVELGVQANILLGTLRGGMRVNYLRESHDSHRFAGVFLSGGVGF